MGAMTKWPYIKTMRDRSVALHDAHVFTASVTSKFYNVLLVVDLQAFVVNINNVVKSTTRNNMFYLKD